MERFGNYYGKLFAKISPKTLASYTGALGIFVGIKLGDKVPELGIKLFAASIFMIFGIQKLWQTVPEQYLNPKFVVPFFFVLILIVTLMARKLIQGVSVGIQSKFKAKSKLIHDYYQHLQEDLENICMGPEFCNACQGHQCAIGHAKYIIRESLVNPDWQGESRKIEFSYRDKPFINEEILDSLIDTLWLIENVKDEKRVKNVNLVRNQLESILIGGAIGNVEGIPSYINEVEKENNELAIRIESAYKMRKPAEDRIINIGNRISNIYMIEMEDGYLLIDTGYKEHYKKFKEALKNRNISLDDIAYVFITHAHDDHVGFLNEILEKTKAKVILHPESIKRLKTGQNSFDGGCSSVIAWSFCQMMKLFGKGDHRFQPVDSPNRYVIVTKDTKLEIEKMLSAKIIELPGHTKDSIGLLFENSVLFCGDAAMNGIPSRNHIIVWIESLKDYETSWMKMISLDFKTVYPSHGKPFAKQKLVENKCELKKIHLHSLK
ncbi:beta-lactamase domain protein [Alkaliphilus metalliredigens QYMF]|uniref:Beta-lactamase domain protein n=1 Tax=Alkaliphilus metalliredigens (strain QYMF) TaxID=293826 RepID=A6TUU9_ALKMQ|nr:MBL fold metallo-hydrolase [Alkaliphilus metalliredigens]ABR49967.1 beta-lactamase domain protein [Alkaliphilus metalliredigens QYMF]